jgi:hypothetical protein
VSCRVWDLSSISCGMEWWNATVYSLHFSTWTRTVWVFGRGIVIYPWFWRVLWRRVCWWWATCVMIYSSAWINEYIRTVIMTIINNQIIDPIHTRFQQNSKGVETDLKRLKMHGLTISYIWTRFDKSERWKVSFFCYYIYNGLGSSGRQ